MTTLNAETIAAILKSRDARRIGIVDRDHHTMTGLSMLAGTSAKVIEELLKALSGAAEALDSKPIESLYTADDYQYEYNKWTAKRHAALTTLAPIRELLKTFGGK